MKKVTDTIAFKLLAPMLSVLALAIVAFGLVMNRLDSVSMRRQLLATTNGLGQSLQAAFVNSMAKRDVEGIKEMLEQVGRTPDVRRIYVTDGAGRVRFASSAQIVGQTIPEAGGASDKPFVSFNSRDAAAPFVMQLTPFKSEKRCQQCHDKGLINLGYLGVEFGAASPLKELSRHHQIYWAWSLVLGVTLCLVLVALVRYFISRPLMSLLPVARRAAGGDLDVEELDASAGDEIAVLSDTLNKMADHLRQLVGQVSERSVLLKLSADSLTATSITMSHASEETSNQAGVVSAAGEEVSKSTQTVAAGVEEMGVSIKEIARNSTAAAKVAGDAVKVAQQTSATMAKLGESSAEIGKVVKLITTIAAQTNLLALNASIEAAGAGEAGRGFAVVANEVKELAKEAAKATEEISRKIEDIQSGTKGAVDAIAQIGAIIGQISDISNSIASAIEEQTVTTGEISRNVTQVSQGSADIARNITGVATAAQIAARDAAETQKAAAELFAMATDLEGLTSKFTMRMTKFIDEAIEAHMKWTKRLLSAIDGGEMIDEAVASVDDRCPLGKWIYGEAAKFSGMVEYAELKQKHAEFHVSAGAVVRKLKSGDKEGARHDTERGAFRENSRKVIALLARLKHSKIAS